MPGDLLVEAIGQGGDMWLDDRCQFGQDVCVIGGEADVRFISSRKDSTIVGCLKTGVASGADRRLQRSIGAGARRLPG